MRGWGVLAVLLCAACGETGRTPPASPACRAPSAVLAESARLAAEGRLDRALDAAQAADRACSTAATRRAIAARRADLWIDEAGRARWDRQSTPADQEQARKLYRNGWDLRLAGRLDDARKALQRSYQASPHPLTLVQLGLLEGAAGNPVEQRRAYARALATAEASRGARARPQFAVGHSHPVKAVAYLQGGRALVSLGRDGALKTWDPVTGRVTRSTTAHDPWQVWTLAVDPAETLVATSGLDGEVALWDADRLEPLSRRKVGSMPRLQFLPDGTGLVAAGADLVLLALPSLEPRWRLRLGKLAAALAVGRDGIAVGFGNQVQLVGFDGKPGATLPQTDEVSALGWSPDGTALGVGLWHSIAVLEQGKERWRASTRLRVQAIGWSRDGAQLAIGQYPRLLELRDPRTGEIHRSAQVDGAGTAIDWAPDGDALAVAGDAISLVGAGDAAIRKQLAAHGEAVDRLVATGGGDLLAWSALDAGDDETLVRNLRSGALLRGPGKLRAISADGAHMVGVPRSRDGERPAERRGAATLEVQPTAGGAAQRFTIEDGFDDVGFAPAGDRLIVVRRQQIEARTLAGEVRWATEDAGPLAGPVRFDTAGKRVLLRRKGDIGVWDLATGALVAHGGGQPPHALISFALHGNLLATGSVDEKLLVTDLGTGARQLRDDHHDDVEALAFTADGALLISGGADGRIFLRDPVGGDARHVLTGHTGWMTGGVVVLPGGRLLASASSDRTVRLWDLHRAAPLATVVGTLADPMLVIAEDGAVDGGPGADALVYWQVGDVQLPGFVGWERHHRSGLLRELLDGGR